MTGAPQTTERFRLGPAVDVPADDARGYTIEKAGRPRKVLVVRWQGELHAYLNRCPHAGTPLDWTPDAFFDRTGRYLMCQTHAALFEPADGFCIDGPCAGDSLAHLPLEVDDDGMLIVKL